MLLQLRHTDPGGARTGGADSPGRSTGPTRFGPTGRAGACLCSRRRRRSAALAGLQGRMHLSHTHAVLQPWIRGQRAHPRRPPTGDFLREPTGPSPTASALQSSDKCDQGAPVHTSVAMPLEVSSRLCSELLAEFLQQVVPDCTGQLSMGSSTSEADLENI